jgi:hypothetical protein
MIFLFTERRLLKVRSTIQISTLSLGHAKGCQATSWPISQTYHFRNTVSNFSYQPKMPLITCSSKLKLYTWLFPCLQPQNQILDILTILPHTCFQLYLSSRRPLPLAWFCFLSFTLDMAQPSSDFLCPLHSFYCLHQDSQIWIQHLSHCIKIPSGCLEPNPCVFLIHGPRKKFIN